MRSFIDWISIHNTNTNDFAFGTRNDCVDIVRICSHVSASSLQKATEMEHTKKRIWIRNIFNCLWIKLTTTATINGSIDASVHRTPLTNISNLNSILANRCLSFHSSAFEDSLFHNGQNVFPAIRLISVSFVSVDCLVRF